MCNSSFSKILAFIGALVVGIAAALLFLFGILCELDALLWVSIGISVILMGIVVCQLFHGERGMRCVCEYASSLFYAALLAMVFALALLVIAPYCWILIVILVGIWATLAAYAIILFCMLVSCFIAGRCGCSCGGNRSSDGGSSCRFG